MSVLWKCCWLRFFRISKYIVEFVIEQCAQELGVAQKVGHGSSLVGRHHQLGQLQIPRPMRHGEHLRQDFCCGKVGVAKPHSQGVLVPFVGYQPIVPDRLGNERGSFTPISRVPVDVEQIIIIANLGQGSENQILFRFTFLDTSRRLPNSLRTRHEPFGGHGRISTGGQDRGQPSKLRSGWDVCRPIFRGSGKTGGLRGGF
jgi:hypothetical protein